MSKIEINLDSANGPKVTYPRGTAAEDVEAEVPAGWEVDWETTPADVLGGRRASPLRRIDVEDRAACAADAVGDRQRDEGF